MLEKKLPELDSNQQPAVFKPDELQHPIVPDELAARRTQKHTIEHAAPAPVTPIGKAVNS